MDTIPTTKPTFNVFPMALLKLGSPKILLNVANVIPDSDTKLSTKSIARGYKIQSKKQPEAQWWKQVLDQP